MTTNILSIVARLNVPITTFTNASWTDSFPFVRAGSAAAYPSPSNVGSGSISVTSVAPQAARGTYLVLLAQDALLIKPGGVTVNYRITSVNGAPVFGFGVSNQYVAGWGAGAWGVTPEYLLSNS